MLGDKESFGSPGLTNRTKASVQPRKHNRYSLKVPVIFSWEGTKDVRRQAVGITRFISLIGAFVSTANPPPLGAKVRLTCFLPPVPGAVQTLQILGDGLVIRVERARDDKTRGGFEVAGRPFVLRRG